MNIFLSNLQIPYFVLSVFVPQLCRSGPRCGTGYGSLYKILSVKKKVIVTNGLGTENISKHFVKKVLKNVGSRWLFI
jgi:hypothetical protein